jgi:preprotein translocase subunit SecE
VARDRKRAKQRRDRRVRESARAAAPSQPTRADVPGSLDHASADVDEFDAAIIRGADGAPAGPAEAAEAEELEEATEDATEDALQEASGPARGGAGGGGGGDGQALAERPSGAPLRGGNRAIGFLRASWAELQRVQWPDRRQVTQATAVVLGFVAIAGAYLGLADFVAKEIVEFIL